MSRRPRVIAAAAVAALFLGVFLASGILEARVQDAPQASVKPQAETATGPETQAAPRPPKERMSVYVLLAWVWFSIAVLLGLLRMRIREADRVWRMGLDRASEKAARGPGR